MFEEFKNNPFFRAKQKQMNEAEKFVNKEGEIYKNIGEYISEKEGNGYVSEEEFLASSWLKEKYRMEYAEIMKYLDTIELTPGQVAIGITKDSMLQISSLDYSVLSGTISTLYGKEQGEEFRKDYDLNRLIRVPEEDRLKVYKEFQNIDQKKDNSSDFSEVFARQKSEMERLDKIQVQRNNELREEQDKIFKTINHSLTRLIQESRDDQVSGVELERMFKECSSPNVDTSKKNKLRVKGMLTFFFF